MDVIKSVIKLTFSVDIEMGSSDPDPELALKDMMGRAVAVGDVIQKFGSDLVGGNGVFQGDCSVAEIWRVDSRHSSALGPIVQIDGESKIPKDLEIAKMPWMDGEDE